MGQPTQSAPQDKYEVVHKVSTLVSRHSPLHKTTLLLSILCTCIRTSTAKRYRYSKVANIDGRTSSGDPEQNLIQIAGNIAARGTRYKKFLDQPVQDQPSWLPWSREGPCSVSCGGRGFVELVRNCSTGRDVDCENQGGRHWDVKICDNGDCSTGWLEWGPISACSVTCDYGVQARLRNCSTGNNADCTGGKNYELLVCNAGICATTTTTPAPVPEWSEWSLYIKCSTTCGPGYSERIRTCSSKDINDCPGKAWEVGLCNNTDCKNDGEWGDWGSWGSCSATCEGGNQTRSRSCNYPDPTNKGDPCLGYSDETEACNEGPCPVDGTWGNWSPYEACSKTCDDGIKIRTRNCTFPPNVLRGKDCPGLDKETTICNEGDCPVDGVWTEWSEWAECTKSCHGGIRFKARVCVFDDSKPKGKDCVGNDIVTEICNTGECVVDGLWGNWLSWSECSDTCGGGLKTHSRLCLYRGTTAHGKDCFGNATEVTACGNRECPVDGSWSSWGAWAQCSKSCGGGYTSRTRDCTYPSQTAPRGKTCEGNSFELKNCGTDLCAVDAYWSDWTRFSSCSVTCGDGERERSRICVHDPIAPLGKNCTGSATEKKACHKSVCPVDGNLTSWTSWTQCSESCGGGTQSRSRQCYFPDSVPHGNDCSGQLVDNQACSDLPCPTTIVTVRTTTMATVDGVWSNWSLYSRCSVSCGNGTRTRNRTCEFDPKALQGAPCSGVSTETDGCFPQECPVDGFWSSWHAWGACSVTCGGGTQSRQRSCDFQVGVPHGADCVGEHVDNQTCSTNLCPVDGMLSEWNEWSECSVTCGGGTHTRNRTCDFQAGYPQGNDCIGKLNQTQGCNNALCPVDGRWSDWEQWSTCSVSCGGGTQTRSRACTYDDPLAPHGNDCSGASLQSQQCNLDNCPVDGHFSQWSDWDSCSTTCGNGTHDRVRKCVYVQNVPRGKDCNGSTSESEECFAGKCPVDGILSSWSSWSLCTVTCGNGTSERNRSCDFPDDTPHGADCIGSLTEVKNCGTNLCPVDGVFSAWSNWTVCSVTCGGGVQQRNRSCIFDNVAPPGNNCTGNWTETQTCGDNPCPVDGVWTDWSDFSNCSTTCGNGTQFRTRQCKYKDGFPRGQNCTGSRSDARECSTNPCPVDGQLSAWSVWTECTKSCNNGTKTRNRTCDFQDGFPRGEDCQGALNETVSCHEDPCPIDGHWSEWTNYTQCTVTCGGGTQTRNRTCIYDKGVPHGAKCFGNITDTQACETDLCPVDGVWGDWQSWSSCPVTCDGGKQARIRECVYKNGAPKGQACVGNENEIRDCATDLCAVDGKLSDWSDWTACSGSCGEGVHFRTRQCIFKAGAPHGKNCTGSLREQEKCTNSADCPVDGFWQKWGRWSRCTKTCGGGTRSRRRTCFFPPGPQGTYCPGPSVKRETCNNDSCAVDGQWNAWTSYSACSATCGGGTQTRTRNCTFPAGAAHGSPCAGQPDQTINCNPDECPQDAQWTSWSGWSTCTVTCAGGTQTRNRTCNWPSSVHGSNCTGDSEESQSCNGRLCPVDGKWGGWSEWGSCSVSCNVGLKSRNRTCVYDDKAPQGAICAGENQERTVCTQQLCEVDGQWANWQDWGQCSVTCGNGTETRKRQCVYVVPGAPHGKDCEGSANQTRECTTAACPVDGVWNTWSTWDSCSESCGGGTKSRNRTCIFSPDTAPHGADCTGNTTDVVDCNTQQCPVDGVWNTWSTWDSCSESCGGGTKSRNRTCIFSPDTAPHGTDCTGNTTDLVDCNTQQCPVDGVWDAWSVWSTCSESCGGGSKSRNRTCVFTPDTAPQGLDCVGNSTETNDCNTVTCLLQQYHLHPIPVTSVWMISCAKICTCLVHVRQVKLFVSIISPMKTTGFVQSSKDAVPCKSVRMVGTRHTPVTTNVFFLMTHIHTQLHSIVNSVVQGTIVTSLLTCQINITLRLYPILKLNLVFIILS